MDAMSECMHMRCARIRLERLQSRSSHPAKHIQLLFIRKNRSYDHSALNQTWFFWSVLVRSLGSFDAAASTTQGPVVIPQPVVMLS